MSWIKAVFCILLLTFFVFPLLATAQSSRTRLAPGVKFMVKEIHVVGNTLLTQAEIDQALAPYEGREEDLTALDAAAAALTKLYHEKGYALAQAYVPPQTISNGIARIAVIEGRVESIQVIGSKAYGAAFIRWFLQPGVKNGLLDYVAFEKALMLLDEFPDLQVRSFLKPGSRPGTTDIVVAVVDKYPLHGQVDYNNFGNAFTGQNRGGLEAWDGDLTGRGDLLDLRGVIPFPSRESPFLQGSYTIPINPSGTKLAVSYANADIKVGSALEVLDIRGTAQIYGLTASQPLLRTPQTSSDVTTSFYYKNVADFVFTSFLTSKDKLRELAFGYDQRWTSAIARDLFDATLTQGLGTWLGGMPKNDPYASRVGADDTFTKLNGDYAHLMKVFGDDFLLLRGAGQLAFNPLAITEQYSLGGPDTVRGYPQSYLLGDSGWNLSGEYRHPLTAAGSPDPLQAAAFFDTGYVTLRNPLVGETGKSHLTGAGVGLRAGFGANYNASLDLGFPLDPPIRLKGGGHQGPTLYGQFTAQF